MKTLFLSMLCFGITLLQAQDPPCNCCSENHQAFDFWVGEWEVHDPNDTLVGTNVITKVQDGCVLKENWQSTQGNFTGTSMNFYNASKGHWQQLWIDNSGSHLLLKGNKDGNNMVLASEEIKPDQGKPYRHRITWTQNDDGTVRQLWEVLEGETVVRVAFDGLYKKRTEAN